MWQRIQSVYLFLALIATTTCLSLPLCVFEPVGMGGSTVMYNLWKITPEGTADFSVWPLFVLLLITCPICLVTIFLFKNRKLQAKLCVVNIILNILWLAYGAFIIFGEKANPECGGIKLAFGACLPIVAIILYALARHSINKDEKLVRSMDRIR